MSSDLLFKIKADGGADFTHVSTVKGWASEISRFSLKLMKPADRDMLVGKVLAAYGKQGSGSFKIAPPAADGDFVSTVVGRTENLVYRPGPVGVATLTSPAGGISQNVYSFTLEKQRSQSFVCIGNDTDYCAGGLIND